MPAALAFRLALAWTRMGSLRSSGDPSRAFAAFQDPGRTDASSPLTVTSMLPPLSGRRRLRRWLISGLTRSFGTCCHTLHAWRCRTRARLASGRPAGPLPGGSRTLWIATRGFSSFLRSSSSPALLTLMGFASLYRGRDAHCWTPPAQIRTCPIRAYGSHLGCLTAKRALGQGCRMSGLGSQSFTSLRIRPHVSPAFWLRC